MNIHRKNRELMAELRLSFSNNSKLHSEIDELKFKLQEGELKRRELLEQFDKKLTDKEKHISNLKSLHQHALAQCLKRIRSQCREECKGNFIYFLIL